MMTATDLKYEAHLEEKYRAMSFKEKIFLSRKLVREGFIKEGPLLYSWWLQEKREWEHPRTVEQAMDDYIENHRNMIYLEDFNPEMLANYPSVGPAKIKEVERRINLYLNSKKK